MQIDQTRSLSPLQLSEVMFTTIDHRQMVSEFPDALEGTKSWSSIEVTHQLPWLYATFVVRVGGLMRARFLLTFSVAELEPSTLIGAEDGDLLSVMLGKRRSEAVWRSMG